MQGHAAANMLPLVASNRIGKEAMETSSIVFYGSSFIADETGAKVAEFKLSGGFAQWGEKWEKFVGDVVAKTGRAP